MIFNSLEFALFLSTIFILYWFVTKTNLKAQNGLLLISSYFFYASWDYRFLFLLIFSTVLDFYTALKIYNAKSIGLKRMWLWISISVNLGFLGIFKYYNFFASSLSDLFTNFGLHPDFWTLSIILPVGISFYTFHGLSYVLDTYNKRITPIKNFVDYSLFVSFFPLLVAGPIERATHLLPQIQSKREFDYAKSVDGLRQILWGLFKKVAIADNCAKFANLTFADPSAYHGGTLILGAFFFAIQIYGDFSGYSDIALGTAKLFGVELLRNFAYPYFSRDIAEFWRRWHISLSSWFRDYLYIPLGGSKGGMEQKIRNTFIIFTVSGLWHGANWTFLAWGIINAVYFLPLLVTSKNRDNLSIAAQGKIIPSIREAAQIGITFCLTTFAWIFFRSDSISAALLYIKNISSQPFLVDSKILSDAGPLLGLIGVFTLLEWLGREQDYAIKRLGLAWPKPLRLALYYIIIFCIFYYAGPEQQFIYFQF